MMANSVELRCPALYKRGRTIPSQAGVLVTLGVCREHVPSPEGKICSELHRNMQRLTEMVSPLALVVPGVTTCSEIVTTTLRNRTGELADNMSRNNAALLRLTRRGNLKTFSGGRTIVQELNYADNQTLNS